MSTDIRETDWKGSRRRTQVSSLMTLRFNPSPARMRITISARSLTSAEIDRRVESIVFIEKAKTKNHSKHNKADQTG